MITIINSCVINGLDGNLIKIEVDIVKGLSTFNIVGLPDTVVKESRDRVRSAIINSGYNFNSGRIVINMSPASSKKEGSHMDLPMALGILCSSREIKKDILDDYVVLGELSLSGKINKTNNILAMLIYLKSQGCTKFIIPQKNYPEGALLKDITIYAAENLKEVVDFLKGYGSLQQIIFYEGFLDDCDNFDLDFSEVIGQSKIKKAMEVAASGYHNIIMLGPPGAGKTMLAKRFNTILPSLSYEEAIEITKIYSIAGKLDNNQPFISTRPFRSPHHTTSPVSIAGGGSNPKPGEISLSHYGVLFMDEFPEFPRSVLEVLRQPMEDEIITISRSMGSYTFPCKFILLASMNPCPCGFYNHPSKECTCTPNQIDKYISKISGPLLDRIDIQVEISPIKFSSLKVKKQEESSINIKKRVEKARDIQFYRYKNENIKYNSQLSGKLMDKYCKLDEQSLSFLESTFNRLSLSTRSYNKIIKISRTIADLDGSESIKLNHITQALQLRNLDNYFNKKRGI